MQLSTCTIADTQMSVLTTVDIQLSALATADIQLRAHAQTADNLALSELKKMITL